MYKAFYKFKEKPFQLSPDPSFLYLSPNHNRALKYLEYGISENIGITLLTGEVGSGKTTLLKYIQKQINQDLEVVEISNTNLSSNELIMYILLELRIEPHETSKAKNLNHFKKYLRTVAKKNRRVILFIDEAQNLSKDGLEEIRMLSNFQADDRLPVQICLIGQPELRTILNAPDMHQIRQRIAVNYHLSGLDLNDTENYILYRLKMAGNPRNPFSSETIELIFESTSGIPRSINIVCDSLLLYGFAEEVQTIDSVIARSVINELNLSAFVKKENRDYTLTNNSSIESNNKGHHAALPTEGDRKYSTDEALTTLKKQLEKTEHDLKYLTNGALTTFQKQLDRIELKTDLLISELLKTAIESLMTERTRCEDVQILNSKIQDDYHKLRSLLKNTAQTHPESGEITTEKYATAEEIEETSDY